MRSRLHQLFWQRLPRRLRRSILVCVTRLLAPRPAPVVCPSDRFIVVGYLRTCSGLGESARLCYDALRAAGFFVAGIDLSAPMMQDAERADFEFKDGSALEGPGTLILHINAPWVPFALLLLGRRLVRGKRVIGFWHWELPQVPFDWRVGYRFVHKICVPTRFVAQAVSNGDFEKKIRIIPHPVALRTFRLKTTKKTEPNDFFTVLVVFNMISGFARKNPIAAIEAFRLAFGNDQHARLIIKATNAQSYQSGYERLLAAIRGTPNIQLLTEQFSAEEMDALYQSADTVLSLHRSEGFGLVIAEAMLHALPVVATDWSGNCDFLNNSNGMPVRYRLIPASDPQGGYNANEISWWADPDVFDASRKLALLRRDQHLRSTLGRRAHLDAISYFSAKNYKDSMVAVSH